MVFCLPRDNVGELEELEDALFGLTPTNGTEREVPRSAAKSVLLARRGTEAELATLSEEHRRLLPILSSESSLSLLSLLLVSPPLRSLLCRTFGEPSVPFDDFGNIGEADRRNGEFVAEVVGEIGVEFPGDDDGDCTGELFGECVFG